MKNNKKLCLAILLSLLIILLPTFLLACNEDTNNETENLGGVPNHILPVIPPDGTQTPPINNNDTPASDPDENEGDETLGGEIDDNGGSEDKGEEQTQEAFVDFESFMSQRETIADTIVNTNKDGILQLLVGGNASKYDIADYSLNVNQKDANDDCNEISSAKMTVVLQNKTSEMQRVVVLNVDFGQTLTETNQNSLVEDCTITKVTSITTTSTDSADIEFKTALAQAFLARTGNNINYTSDDIHLNKGSVSISGNYGNVRNYTLVISNDEGVVKLSGRVKESSDVITEIQTGNMEGIEGEQIEDFHTIAEHNANCNKE